MATLPPLLDWTDVGLEYVLKLGFRGPCSFYKARRRLPFTECTQRAHAGRRERVISVILVMVVVSQLTGEHTEVGRTASKGQSWNSAQAPKEDVRATQRS